MEITTNKPWGREVLLYQGSGYAVKRIHLNESNQTSLHYHEVKHETILMLKGKLRIEIQESGKVASEIFLASGEHFCISPKIIHRMRSIGEDSIYFEAQTDHLDDVIRISDDFGRN
ncbi:unannotated protein [freshwater metagenome]|uniref:Unannotated protein n=1 Tax=freshwater metagenome TaxID=449393 RepID=A0A6J7A0H8_9ZZZZ|nr:cupin [Actinomycetota bacterium]MSW25672.1 cupin [Actinomycetota bacterium]MSW33404.1 cupin [Actinomycetota bacterium]MSX30428.1 cupin [Actinomycetota bacterium]MSX51340.1 cupin [Actinomycetota bacterium]